MSSRLVSLTFDATDPIRLARFWASALGWKTADESGDEIGVIPTDGTRVHPRLRAGTEAMAAKNPIHPELMTESVEDQRAVVGRLLELGACHVDIGQGPERDDGTVLADPEGNEPCVGVRGEFFCRLRVPRSERPSAHILRPATSGCRRSGGRSSTRRAATSPFAVQSEWARSSRPALPGRAKYAKGRLRLDIAPQVGADHAEEVDRLLALGPRRHRTG
jgi:hypothetical protein